MVLAFPARAEDIPLSFDHSQWDQFLKKFVNEKGEVNYRAAKDDPSLLDAYLEKLKSFPRQSMENWSREEQIAFLINAYNAGVVKTILDHYPLKSVLEIPGGWEEGLVQIGHQAKISEKEEKEKAGKAFDPMLSASSLSLNQIERFWLRFSFRNEKIIFTLSRGAKGAPRLRREAYVGPQLEGQLYLAAREFVNDPQRNQIEIGAKKIILSRIFQWYADDFVFNWGNYPEQKGWNSDEQAMLNFLSHYLDDPLKVEYLREGKYKVKYSVFDWSLNDAPGQ